MRPALSEIAAVRRFNRFFTRQVGALRRGLLGTEFSLTEARVLYELGQRSAPSAGKLAAALELDAGQLSRILRRLQDRGLVSRAASKKDARRAALALSPRGRRAFAQVDGR